MLGRRRGRDEHNRTEGGRGPREQDAGGASDFRRGRTRLPDGLSVPTRRGEQVLAVAQDDLTGVWMTLTAYRVMTLTQDGAVEVDRPWHEVDTGAWEPDSSTLSLSWVGGGRGLQWQLRERTGPGAVPQAFRDRVSASVVLVREIDLGPRRTARVSIRAVLGTRELVDQVLRGRGVRGDDRELEREIERCRRDLREQVGLPPA